MLLGDRGLFSHTGPRPTDATVQGGVPPVKESFKIFSGKVRTPEPGREQKLDSGVLGATGAPVSGLVSLTRAGTGYIHPGSYMLVLMKLLKAGSEPKHTRQPGSLNT